MTQPSQAEAMLSRLLTVNWDGDADASYRHAVSRAKLMQEYLRRSASWAEQLNATEEWPFFDIAALAAPQVESPPELAEQLETLIQAQIGWPSQLTIARAALRWAAARDAGTPVPPELEDPYRPILLMLQRGGGWTTESNFIDLGGSSVVEKTWRDHLSNEPVTVLDSAMCI